MNSIPQTFAESLSPSTVAGEPSDNSEIQNQRSLEASQQPSETALESPPPYDNSDPSGQRLRRASDEKTPLLSEDTYGSIHGASSSHHTNRPDIATTTPKLLKPLAQAFSSAKNYLIDSPHQQNEAHRQVLNLIDQGKTASQRQDWIHAQVIFESAFDAYQKYGLSTKGRCEPFFDIPYFEEYKLKPSAACMEIFKDSLKHDDNSDFVRCLFEIFATQKKKCTWSNYNIPQDDPFKNNFDARGEFKAVFTDVRNLFIEWADRQSKITMRLLRNSHDDLAYTQLKSFASNVNIALQTLSRSSKASTDLLYMTNITKISEPRKFLTASISAALFPGLLADVSNNYDRHTCEPLIVFLKKNKCPKTLNLLSKIDQTYFFRKSLLTHSFSVIEDLVTTGELDKVIDETENLFPTCAELGREIDANRDRRVLVETSTLLCSTEINRIFLRLLKGCISHEENDVLLKNGETKKIATTRITLVDTVDNHWLSFALLAWSNFFNLIAAKTDPLGHKITELLVNIDSRSFKTSLPPNEEVSDIVSGGWSNKEGEGTLWRKLALQEGLGALAGQTLNIQLDRFSSNLLANAIRSPERRQQALDLLDHSAKFWGSQMDSTFLRGEVLQDPGIFDLLRPTAKAWMDL